MSVCLSVSLTATFIIVSKMSRQDRFVNHLMAHVVPSSGVIGLEKVMNLVSSLAPGLRESANVELCELERMNTKQDASYKFGME